MSLRFIVHLGLCVGLVLIGGWLYLQLSETSSYSVSSIQVASYWFALLVFILFSWFFYWIIHKRSGQAWMIALMIALLIAAISTGTLLFISHEHEAQRQQVLEDSQQSEVEELNAPGQTDSEPNTQESEELEELLLDEEQAIEGLEAQP